MRQIKLIVIAKPEYEYSIAIQYDDDTHAFYTLFAHTNEISISYSDENTKTKDQELLQYKVPPTLDSHGLYTVVDGVTSLLKGLKSMVLENQDLVFQGAEHIEQCFNVMDSFSQTSIH